MIRRRLFTISARVVLCLGIGLLGYWTVGIFVQLLRTPGMRDSSSETGVKGPAGREVAEPWPASAFDSNGYWTFASVSCTVAVRSVSGAQIDEAMLTSSLREGDACLNPSESRPILDSLRHFGAMPFEASGNSGLFFQRDGVKIVVFIGKSATKERLLSGRLALFAGSDRWLLYDACPAASQTIAEHNVPRQLPLPASGQCLCTRWLNNGKPLLDLILVIDEAEVLTCWGQHGWNVHLLGTKETERVFALDANGTRAAVYLYPQPDGSRFGLIIWA